MLTNFIYAKSKAMFEERLAEVPNDAIVFIEDTKEIWNHGHYFAGEGVNVNDFNNLQTQVAEIVANMGSGNKDWSEHKVSNIVVGEDYDIEITPEGISGRGDLHLSAGENGMVWTEALHTYGVYNDVGPVLLQGEQGINCLSTIGSHYGLDSEGEGDGSGWFWNITPEGDAALHHIKTNTFEDAAEGTIYGFSEESGADTLIATNDNLKTINGEPLIGDGDLKVKIKDVVDYTMADNADWVLYPDKIYNIYSDISSIRVTGFENSGSTYEEYCMIFRTGSTIPSITLPEGTYWANGEIPEVETDTEYELSIIARRDNTLTYHYKAILTSFKQV